MTSDEGTHRHINWKRWIPFLWVALSAGWLIVIFVTDTPAWPLAVWIATTVGPIIALQRSADAPAVADSP